MYTIRNNVVNEVIINKSRFIAYLYKVESIDEINQIIENIKKEHKDANHHVYAYRLKTTEKISDDKEPSGTAGLPILTTLKQKELYNVLCIVVRYFGGIKLGSGGLIRAYRNSCSDAINKTTICPLLNMMSINISFFYADEPKVTSIIDEEYIVKKEYKDKIIYYLNIPENEWESAKNDLINIIIIV